MYVPVVPLAVLLFFSGPGAHDALFGAFLLLLLLLLLVRQLIALHENASLNRQLASLTLALEIKVQTQTMRLLRSRASEDSELRPPGKSMLNEEVGERRH